MQKPVVAMIDGVAARAGMRAAPACDFRIMSWNAKLIQAFVKTGLALNSRSTFFLPRLHGYTKAFELAVSWKEISAEETLSSGIVNRAFAEEYSSRESQKILEDFAGGPTKAHSLMKREKIFLRQRRLTEVLNMKFTCRKLLFKRTTRSRESMLLLKNGRSL